MPDVEQGTHPYGVFEGGILLITLVHPPVPAWAGVDMERYPMGVGLQLTRRYCVVTYIHAAVMTGGRLLVPRPGS
jgi:hypothetical protein